MKKPKRFIQKHPNIIVELISFFILLLAFLALLSYYLNRYTKIVDIIIIISVLLLSIDSLLYSVHAKKYKTHYIYLGFLFIIVIITHLSRFLFGPFYCLIFQKLFSLYFYDGLALLVGFLLLYLSLYLMRKRSGVRYHHLAGILVGSAMIINHLIKIIIGKCV